MCLLRLSVFTSPRHVFFFCCTCTIAKAAKGGTAEVDKFVAGYLAAQGIRAKLSRRGKGGVLVFFFGVRARLKIV